MFSDLAALKLKINKKIKAGKKKNKIYSSIKTSLLPIELAELTIPFFSKVSTILAALL